jgi:hypothetical protein
MSQLDYKEEGNCYQWQVHSLTKRDYITVTEIPNTFIMQCKTKKAHFSVIKTTAFYFVPETLSASSSARNG